ncbi:MAG: hypothetical protein ABIR87_06430 [Sphingomicrobium sp.]
MPSASPPVARTLSYTALVVALLLAILPAPVVAQATAPFDQRVTAIVTRPMPIRDLRQALARLARDARSPAEEATVAAYGLMAELLTSDDKIGLARAEAFAAAHPGSVAAQLVLAQFALRADQPQRSANLLIEAAPKANFLIDAIADRTVASVLGKLRQLHDLKRASDVSRALLEAHWSRGSPILRSQLAAELIRDELRQGHRDAALRWLPVVRDPTRLYLMLADRDYATIAPDIDLYAGPKLERRWRDYLGEAQRRWARTGDPEDGSDYADALRDAGLDKVLIDQFQARFARGYNCPNDPGSRVVGAYLVTSLANLGEISRAEKVLFHLGGNDGSVDGNRLSILFLSKGRFADAARVLQGMLTALGKAAKPTSDYELQLLRARLACATYRQGKPVDPPDIDALVLPVRLWTLHCFDRAASAKATLLAAIANPLERGDALAWVQPDALLPAPSAFESAMLALDTALKADPAIVAAIARYGSIHDYSPNAAVQRGGQWVAVKGQRPPPCGNLVVAPNGREAGAGETDLRQPG